MQNYKIFDVSRRQWFSPKDNIQYEAIVFPYLEAISAKMFTNTSSIPIYADIPPQNDLIEWLDKRNYSHCDLTTITDINELPPVDVYFFYKKTKTRQLIRVFFKNAAKGKEFHKSFDLYRLFIDENDQ